MATEVILPRVDMDMVDAKVAHWYFKGGDAVKKGQVLFEIETDKATMEVEATADGILHVTQPEIGVVIPVGEVIGWILVPGEALPAPTGTEVAKLPPGKLAPGADSQAESTEASVVSEPAEAGRSMLRATPLARSLAREHGIDLGRVVGSGPGGRIIARDLRSALDEGSAKAEGHSLHLHWARRGGGTPLLLIHGFGADQGSWRPLLQHLPHERAVVAIDLPNHGKSEARAVQTLQEVAAEVLKRLDAEGIPFVHLLGHSLGGAVALALAKTSPERVRSLTLLAPVGLGTDIDGSFIDGLVSADDEPSLKAVMTALFHDPAGLTGSFVATAFKQLQSSGRRAALATMARQFMPSGRQAESLRDAFAELQVPVQVIWGTGDRIIPTRHGLGLPSHVALHLLPSVGHLPQIEAAALVGALVDHLLRLVPEPA